MSWRFDPECKGNKSKNKQWDYIRLKVFMQQKKILEELKTSFWMIT